MTQSICKFSKLILPTVIIYRRYRSPIEYEKAEIEKIQKVEKKIDTFDLFRDKNMIQPGEMRIIMIQQVHNIYIQVEVSLFRFNSLGNASKGMEDFTY